VLASTTWGVHALGGKEGERKERSWNIIPRGRDFPTAELMPI